LADRHLFQLAGYAPQPGVAVVDIETLSPPRRIGRALGGFGAWLGAGILCVFIPIAHFILVPSCLIGSVVMLMRRLAQRRLVVKAQGTCPDCGADQDLDIVGPFPGRTDLFCRSCHRPLKLVFTELPAAA
jgi:hypothetical protein